MVNQWTSVQVNGGVLSVLVANVVPPDLLEQHEELAVNSSLVLNIDTGIQARPVFLFEETVRSLAFGHLFAL